jgi:hypothetical protein
VTVGSSRNSFVLGARWSSIIKHVSFVPSLIRNLIQISVYLLFLTLLCEINTGSCIPNG